LSFRLKTIVGVALIESVLLLILVFSGLNYLAKSNELQLQQRAVSTASLFASATQDAVLARDLATIQSATDEILTDPDVVYVRVTSNNFVLAENGSNPALMSDREQDFSLADVTDGIYDVKAEIEVEGKVYGLVELGLSTTYIDTLLTEARQSAFGLAGAEIILVAIFSLILGNYLTRQLRLLETAARLIASEGPGYTVEINSNDEIGAVASAFNTMSASLSRMNAKADDDTRIRAELMESANRSEAISKAILSSSLDAIICIDKKGDIIEFNKVATQMFGWEREQVSGMNICDTIIPEKYVDAHNKGMEHYHATGEGPVLGQRLELEAKDKTGRVFPIEISISPITTHDETLFAAYIRDLTETRLALAAQDLARKQAEQANEAKSRFLATMSHEIRSPLTAIMGMNGMLLESGLTAHQMEIASTLNDGSEVLLSLINDILDFSKIESGQMALNNDWFDLKTSVQRIVNLLAMQSNLDQVEVVTVFSADMCARYFGDQPRINQVVINLLSNAIKFTPSGKVTIHLLPGEDGEGILLEVTDTGIGMDEDQLQHIFKEFAQAEDSASRRFGGTGLGLAIARHLVKLMDGEILVTSEKNVGSCFVVKLPLEGSNSCEDTTQFDVPDFAVSEFERVHLLLAEDSATNRRVIKASLSKMGLQVDTAENGLEAVNLAMEKKYDLILMDLAMPEMDGLEATRKIRSGDGKNANSRIIAITANAFEEDRERCFAAGMNEFVSKPINIQSFRSRIQRWLREDRGSEMQPEISNLLDIGIFNQLYKDTGAEVLPEIFSLFAGECRQRLITMSEAHGDRDVKILEDQAHALKSSSGSFGAIKLEAVAQEIEKAASDGDIAVLDKNISQLEALVERSLEALLALIQRTEHE
jgi:PAS domain S-box-containing protein